MPLLSLCLIMRDESLMLHKSLTSVAPLCDEIIIVDTGSKDNSVQIAKEFTDQVYHFQWIDDFSAARNFAQSKSTGKYIMRWDGDCVLDDPIELQQLKANSFYNKEIIMAKFFAEGKDAGNAISQLSPLIYERQKFHWIGCVHERLFSKISNSKQIDIYKAMQTSFYNHKEGKDYRYAQNFFLVHRQLAKNPKDSRQLFFLAAMLMFESKYQQAIKITQKAIKYADSKDYSRLARMLEMVFLCDQTLGQTKHSSYILGFSNRLENVPRFMLLLADLEVVVNPTKALDLYLEYLKNPICDLTNDESYDPERLMFHPNYTVGSIYLTLNNINQAKFFFQKAIRYTRNQDYIEAIESIMKLL